MSARPILPSLLKRPISSTFSQQLLTRSVSINSAINRGLGRFPTNNKDKSGFKPRDDKNPPRGGRRFSPPKIHSIPARFHSRDRSPDESGFDTTPRNQAQRYIKEPRRARSSNRPLPTPNAKSRPSSRLDYSHEDQGVDTDRPSPRLDRPSPRPDSPDTSSSGIWNPPDSTPRPTARIWAPSPESYTDAFPGSRSWQPPNNTNPRLDYIPQDVEWIPKHRRVVPKIDEDSEWIYGTSVVEAALKAERREMLRLYIYAGGNRTKEARARDIIMARMARKVGAEVVEERDLGLLDSMSDSRPHNGYVLECLPLLKTPILSLGIVTTTKSCFSVNLAQHTSSNEEIPVGKHSSIIYNRSPKDRYPFVLMLDEIVDPGNLGAILRSAYFLGVTAVTVSSRNCAPLSPVCLKASSGAAEFIPILEQSRSDKLISSSIADGWTFYAAVPPVTKQQIRRDRYVLASHISVGTALERGPVCLVLGGEGEGLRPMLKRTAQYCVSLEKAPGTDRVVDSLNVSVAAALLCNSFLKGTWR